MLIEDYMVKDMKPGSVIVDLAAAGHLRSKARCAWRARKPSS